ncbi:hypothetical protein [Lentzea aerocolonigenes]|uniref:hypothetical protein n=1 Tax=Lentzea aerocolonigenes TaxID=68170 RepID=UPI000AFF2B2D|nr:hypothetical protein [Lentzea aerocolonigenes]
MRWSAAAKTEIVEAAAKASAGSAGRPWVVELNGRSAYLYEVAHSSSRDPLGVEGLLSCGAALEHVVLAVRVTGWHAQAVFPADHRNPGLVAIVRSDRVQSPTEAEIARHRAIRLPDGTADGDVRALASANHWAGTELYALDEHTLVVLTAGDTRCDHVRGGAALQSAVLAARSAGLRVCPVVHLPHRQEWRTGLIERHGLAGFPQALLTVGAKVPGGAGPTTAFPATARS